MKSFLKRIVIYLLTIEARAALFRYRPKIVAIVGSVGKTTTKDMIAAVLAEKFSVRKSPKSFNSDIGVPLAILGINESGWGSADKWAAILFRGARRIFQSGRRADWLVLEVGADHPGDISRIARWLAPDCVVVTRFGETPVHLEFFPSREALISEKSSLARTLKEDNLLILNSDDTDVYALKDISPARVIAFGTNDKASFRVSHAAISYKDGFPEGINAKIEFNGKMTPLFLKNTIGLHYVSSTLAAIAVANECGVQIPGAIAALKELSLPAGRMRVLRGVRGAVLIDDSYNSSPAALSAALRALKELEVPGRKIAVLGDMLELGGAEASAHEKAGMEAARVVNFLVTVGERARWMEKGAQTAGLPTDSMRHFDSALEAGRFLRDFLVAGDAVLLKASQGIRMEKAVAELLLHPAEKEKLLVRQEKEWKTRH